MTKKELIDAMADMPDDAEVVIEVVINRVDDGLIEKTYVSPKVRCGKTINKIILA